MRPTTLTAISDTCAARACAAREVGNRARQPRPASIARAARPVLVAAGLLLLVPTARAGDIPKAATLGPGAELAAGDFAVGGVATCIECHDETEEHPVLSIFKTRHATVSDPSTPFANANACQVCHGPSAAHVEDPNTSLPGVVFGDERPAAAQNAACMQCHAGASRMNWGGSVHESREVSCTACHSLHAEQDAVLRNDLEPLALSQRKTQAEVCFQCHQEQRAEIQRVSSHPIRQGTMTCSDCHNPHGSAGPHSLNQLTLNEQCYECHAEKRGPFLWEHGPVREDCSTCHTPHGSVQNALLSSRQPFLCQECHLGTRHVSTNYNGTGLIANGGVEEKLLGQSCTNCHSEIHGSNHPSGVRWTR